MLKPLPTLRQLRYLTALAQYRHFGQAADACLATQSTVSAGLSELESVLNVTLVERSRRRVLMTPLGQRIADQAAHILQAAEDLVDLAQMSRQAPLTGPLSLGVIPTIAPYILPAFLPDLRRSFPRLKLHLREDLTANLLTRLEGGELDAALIALPYPCDGLETLPLSDDGFVFACPPDHPLARKAAVTGADLEGAGLVLLEEGHCLRDHSLTACALTPAALGETVQATSLFTLVQMVASGLGVTILPQLAVNHGLLTGTSVIVRPLSAAAPKRTLALCWRDSSVRRAEFQLLARHIAPCLT